MRILVGLGELIPPQGSGGSQKVAAEVAGLLARGGDDVALAGRLAPKQRSGFAPALQAVSKGRWFHREPGPYDRFRFFRSGKGFSQVLDTFKPDVVVMHTMSAMPLANLAATRKIPLVLYWHDVEFHRLGGFLPEGAVHVANSQFTATRLQQRFGVTAQVIPPIFSPPSQQTQGEATHDRLLFINPVADKGLDRVVEIAQAFPDLTVEIIESWVMNKDEQKGLRARLGALPNVVLTPWRSDMAPVYQRAWILLAPSRWEEAWGRVATEAHSYGVPVLATRIGGLTESVGTGGILFSPSAGLRDWTDTIRHLQTNRQAYDDLVRTTRAASSRPEVDPGRNIQLLRETIVKAAS